MWPISNGAWELRRVRAENVQPFVAASNALYKAVVEPAASLIGDKRLLIVADGALNYIPFEALVKTARRR